MYGVAKKYADGVVITTYYQTRPGDTKVFCYAQRQLANLRLESVSGWFPVGVKPVCVCGWTPGVPGCHPTVKGAIFLLFNSRQGKDLTASTYRLNWTEFRRSKLHSGFRWGEALWGCTGGMAKLDCWVLQDWLTLNDWLLLYLILGVYLVIKSLGTHYFCWIHVGFTVNLVEFSDTKTAKTNQKCYKLVS